MIDFYTKAQIEQHQLEIPTDDEIEELLQKLQTIRPVCGSSSQNQVTPNGFCVCSQIGANTIGCYTC